MNHTIALTDFIREKITKLRIMLKSQPHLTPNDQETLINIDALYEDWRNQTLQEGRKEGQKESDRTTLESMLVVKFGTYRSQTRQHDSGIIGLESDRSGSGCNATVSRRTHPKFRTNILMELGLVLSL